MANKKIEGTEEAWDTGALGRDEAYAQAAPDDLGKSADEAAGMQMISIRLPKSMIEGFKFISTHHNNIKYQTLMRQILQRFVTSEIAAIGRNMEAVEARARAHQAQRSAKKAA